MPDIKPINGEFYWVRTDAGNDTEPAYWLNNQWILIGDEEPKVAVHEIVCPCEICDYYLAREYGSQ